MSDGRNGIGNGHTDVPEERSAEEALLEIAFVITPLLILTVLSVLYRHHFLKIAESEEWSFAAVVLMGQALANHYLASTRRPNENYSMKSTFRMIVLFFGLVTAAIVNTVVLVENSETETPDSIYIVAQLTTFALSLIAYLSVTPLGSRIAGFWRGMRRSNRAA